MTLVFILLYLCIQVGIGIWASRKTSSESDFFLAGRGVGLLLATFSIFGTWFGAETSIGSAGAVFSGGLYAARAEPTGHAICLVALGLLLAGKLRRRQYLTLADLFRERYSPFIEQIAVWIIVPGTILWAGAQIMAFGQILAGVSSLSPFIGMVIATSFALVYTSFGGLLGDMITDFVQSIVIILGLVILFVLTCFQLGSFESVISTIPPIRLSLTAPGDTFFSTLDSWLIPIFGPLIAQELVSKVLACKTDKIAKKSAYLAAILYFVIGSIPVFLGLIGPIFIAPMQETDQFLPELARTLLPPSLFIVFSGALISAILSTIDSTLLSNSALISHNFIFPLMKNKPSEKTKVFIGRIIVVLSGILAFCSALITDSIYELIEIATSLGTAGLVVVTLFGLWFPKFGGKWAALTSLIVGIVAIPIAEYGFNFGAPFSFALFASIVAYILCHFIEKYSSHHF